MLNLTIAALFLLGSRPDAGDFLAVDDFNVYLIVLNTFVGFTTSLYSASYIDHELESGHLTPAYLRFYHAMYQAMMGAMNLALANYSMTARAQSPQPRSFVPLAQLPGNSAKALMAALAKVAKPGEQLDGVGIDPRLFRAFGIESVPTYVVTSSDFDLCDGFDCRTQVPPHDRMSGNVSAAYALETFARGGGPGALLAAQHLARLERQVP